MVVKNKIKKHRLDKKLSRRDLAKLLNVSTSAVGYWETGINTPRIDKLKKMTKLFDCTINDLIL